MIQKIFILLFIFGCSLPETKKDIGELLNVSLLVSGVHQNYYVDISNSFIPQEELNILFPLMKEHSDPVCEKVWGQKSHNIEVVHQFLNKDIFGKKPFDSWHHPLPKLIAGCWNFYKMNDKDPDHDFKLAESFYPEVKKDCFSVGFMQPYFMSNILGCERITVVDIDWRIHYGHFQLLNLFKQKAFLNSEMVEDSISLMDIGWVAFDNKIKSKVPSNIGLYCKTFHKELCENTLLGFQNSIQKEKEFRLMLSSLHEANYKKLENTISVIYFSNALEALYTSKEEFNKIYNSISDSLKNSEKAVLIFHAGGRTAFGIYEMEKIGDKSELKTICKDKYTATAQGNTEITYKTYLDYKSSTKNPASCLLEYKKRIKSL
ncbi:MAG: hypothetical protein KDK36_14620 [Leptospiraceae bacterium]|nr:hypothetical protein [Leptospiraceae bacterium]